MSVVNVILSEDQTAVVAYFSGPQDPEVRPDVVEIESSDPRYAAYFTALPEVMRVGMPEPVSAT